jgi:hypothetical protein
MINSDTVSVRLQVAWDWSTTFTQPQEVAKISPTLFAAGGLTSGGYPRDVMVTRVRFRGSGRALLMRFTTSPDKDFSLAGWSIEGTARDKAEGAR